MGRLLNSYDELQRQPLGTTGAMAYDRSPVKAFGTNYKALAQDYGTATRLLRRAARRGDIHSAMELPGFRQQANAAEFSPGGIKSHEQEQANIAGRAGQETVRTGLLDRDSAMKMRIAAGGGAPAPIPVDPLSLPVPAIKPTIGKPVGDGTPTPDAQVWGEMPTDAEADAIPKRQNTADAQGVNSSRLLKQAAKNKTALSTDTSAQVAQKAWDTHIDDIAKNVAGFGASAKDLPDMIAASKSKPVSGTVSGVGGEAGRLLAAARKKSPAVAESTADQESPHAPPPKELDRMVAHFAGVDTGKTIGEAMDEREKQRIIEGQKFRANLKKKISDMWSGISEWAAENSDKPNAAGGFISPGG